MAGHWVCFQCLAVVSEALCSFLQQNGWVTWETLTELQLIHCQFSNISSHQDCMSVPVVSTPSPTLGVVIKKRFSLDVGCVMLPLCDFCYSLVTSDALRMLAMWVSS